MTVNALAVPSMRQGGAGFATAMLIDGLSHADGIDALAVVSEGVKSELAELAPDAATLVAEPRTTTGARKAFNYLGAVRRPDRLDVGYTLSRNPPADLVHWPISFMNAPEAPRGAKKVVTLLDLQHEFYPQFFSRHDRALRKMRWGPSMRAADHVVAISDYTKETACERYGLPESRVTTIHLAIRSTLAAPASGDSLPLLPEGEPAFLYPASPLPAKNHRLLIEAFRIYLDRRPDGGKLLLSGPRMHSWDPVISQVEKAGLTDSVVLLGHVTEQELVGLYGNVSGMIFPSLFEGFGLPVLEAMLAGCPVATSNAASLPEIAGGAAHMFDPTDPEDIAGGIEWLADLSGERRAEVVAAGRARAAEFSVDRMVDKSLALYRELVG